MTKLKSDGMRTFKKVEKSLHKTEGPLFTRRQDAVRMTRQKRCRTKPEMIVKKFLFELGHRYRTNNNDLPGSPDIANRARKWAVFVHGCYWHAHEGCKYATVPKRNREFWLKKFARNKERDESALRELREAGFLVNVIWECDTRNTEELAQRLSGFSARLEGE